MSINRLTMRLRGTIPEDMSLSMLADYLGVLSSIYGYKDKIHFKSISKGSACINAYTSSREIYLQVIERTINHIKKEKPSYRKLVDMITKDNLSAEIIKNDGVVIGTIKPEIDNTQEIRKKSRIQGKLYSIGGKGETINVKIQGSNNESYVCVATVGLATQLSQYLFKCIRIHGMGTWGKKKNAWILKNLIIEKYHPLEKTSLSLAIDSVAKANGNRWKSDDNPDETIKRMRDFD